VGPATWRSPFNAIAVSTMPNRVALPILFPLGKDYLHEGMWQPIASPHAGGSCRERNKVPHRLHLPR